MALPRPRVHLLRGDDPERSIDDPALAALAAQGWTVAGLHVVHVDMPGGEKAHSLLMILWPPVRPASQLGWSHLVVAISAAASAIGTVLIALGTLGIAYGLRS